MFIRIFSVLAAFTALSAVFSGAEAASLAYLAEKKQPITVYVGSFTDESNAGGANADQLKKHLEQALSKNKSVRFDLTADRERSDVEVSGSIKSFKFSDNKYENSLLALPEILLDILIPQSYAKTQVQFIVIDPLTGIELWNSTVTGRLKRQMNVETGTPALYESVSRNFLLECFGKGK